ncbi:hypothetical protein [Foetidibacter luteolus]|uniref:hypothetical protein n=1 Tax=Foetidibacter luteolus TaxID=2608880 RepID=UPI00129B9809|nr:hypothetical protein [Foetidibacter luteolus]
MKQAIIAVVILSLCSITVKAQQLENEDWANHRIYKKGSDTIIILSEGLEKIKSYSRKISLKRIKVTYDSAELKKKIDSLNRIESLNKQDIICRLIIDKVKYFDKKGAIIVTSTLKQKNDKIDILNILNNLPGSVKEENVKATNIENDSIDVDCEILEEYINSLPDKMPEPIETATSWYGWFGSINIIGGFSGNRITVDTAFFSNTGSLTTREQEERNISVWGGSLTVGYRINQRHMAYAEGMYTSLGFESRYHSVNWNSGLPDTPLVIHRYKISSKSFGVGYMYSTAKDSSFLHLLIAAGIYGSYADKYWINDEKTGLPNTMEKGFRFTNKLGIGITLGHRYDRINFNLMPFYMWDWTPINHGQLATRLYMWGVNAGLTINWYKKTSE